MCQYLIHDIDMTSEIFFVKKNNYFFAKKNFYEPLRAFVTSILLCLKF